MIVGSLLLILVAVTLLVTGLAAGSSVLLISSIAASLLAAVALVVGARQAAAARVAAAGQARSPLSGEPGPATAAFDADAAYAGRRSAEASHEHVADERPGTGWSSVTVPDPDAEHPAGQGDTAGQADTEVLRGHPAGDGPAERRPAGYGPDRGADREAAETTQADLTYDGPAYPDVDTWSTRSEPGSGDPRRAAAFEASSGDVHRDAHRDDVGRAAPGRTDLNQADRDQPGFEPAGADRPDRERPDRERSGTDGVQRSADGPDPAYAELPDPAQAGRDDVLAQLAADDTDEDPADEPLPQRIQPTDAVRVSRMTADVLVVDGRPRYHLADCPHLDGRDSEPLPVAEAVDLGFTPCGLCRPVDRLVAGAAHR
jgi:hypothetical protein